MSIISSAVQPDLRRKHVNWQKVLGIVFILGSVLIVNLKPKLPAKTNEV